MRAILTDGTILDFANATEYAEYKALTSAPAIGNAIVAHSAPASAPVLKGKALEYVSMNDGTIANIVRESVSAKIKDASLSRFDVQFLEYARPRGVSFREWLKSGIELTDSKIATMFRDSITRKMSSSSAYGLVGKYNKLALASLVK